MPHSSFFFFINLSVYHMHQNIKKHFTHIDHELACDFRGKSPTMCIQMRNVQ